MQRYSLTLTGALVAVNAPTMALTQPAGAAGRFGMVNAQPSAVIDLSGTVTRARKGVVPFPPFLFSANTYEPFALVVAVKPTDGADQELNLRAADAHPSSPLPSR